MRDSEEEMAMSDADALDCLAEAGDLVRLKELRHRVEAAAIEAATIAAEAERVAGRLRNRAQWLALQEEYRRRRREAPRQAG
jgi:hypothetical protein